MKFVFWFILLLSYLYFWHGLPICGKIPFVVNVFVSFGPIFPSPLLFFLIIWDEWIWDLMEGILEIHSTIFNNAEEKAPTFCVTMNYQPNLTLPNFLQLIPNHISYHYHMFMQAKYFIMHKIPFGNKKYNESTKSTSGAIKLLTIQNFD